MFKTLTAAALAILGSAAAFAQSAPSVTIYGLYDAATRHASNAGAAGASRTTMEDGIITGTRLGLRGREDLGGGLLAVFTLEAGIDPSTGLSLQASPTADFGQVASATRFFGREAHLGLRIGAGGVTLGRQYTVAHSLASRFQPLGNPNSTAHSLFSSHHVARQDNLLRVDASIGGIEVQASHTLGEQAGRSANGAWALGVGQTGKGWAWAAYAQQLKNLAGTETRKIVGAGGNVRLGEKLALFGGLMQRTSDGSAQKNRAWTLGANVELAPLVTLSVAHFDDRQSGSATLDGSRRVSWVNVSYRLSRRTDVYAVLDQNRVAGGYAKPAFMGTTGTQTGTVLGLRHRF